MPKGSRIHALLPIMVLALILLPNAGAVERHAVYSTAAADDDADVAPLLTLIEAAPKVVTLATSEAARDGTADDAMALVAAMRAFSLGFEDSLTPEGGMASFNASVLGDAAEIVNLLEPVPGEIGQLSRNRARCESWGGNATSLDYGRWRNEFEPSLAGLQASISGLDRLAAQYADRVSTAPLVEARGHLVAWLDAEGSRTIDCFQRAGALSYEPELHISVSPATSWPTGTVVVRGSVLYGPDTGTVDVDVDDLSIHGEADLDPKGGFTYRFMVPTDAAIGDVEVHATSGDLHAVANLTIDRAPARLDLTYPLRVAPGERFDVAVRLLVPAHLKVPENASVDLAGHATDVLPLVNGTGTLTLVAPPDETTINGSVHYDGTALLRSAESPYLIVVAHPVAAVDARAGELLGATVARQPTTAIPLAILLAATVALVAARAWSRRRHADVAEAAAASAAARPEDGGVAVDGMARLVPLFAAVRRFLVRLGLVRRSHTARELDRELSTAWGVDSKAVVRRFEEARYGGRADAADADGSAKGWARQVWGRVKP